MGPTELPDPAKSWCLLWKTKRELYGKDARPDSRAGGSDGDKSKIKRSDSDIEPMTYWGMQPAVYEDLLLRGSGKKR